MYYTSHIIHPVLGDPFTSNYTPEIAVFKREEEEEKKLDKNRQKIRIWIIDSYFFLSLYNSKSMINWLTLIFSDTKELILSRWFKKRNQKIEVCFKPVYLSNDRSYDNKCWKLFCTEFDELQIKSHSFFTLEQPEVRYWRKKVKNYAWWAMWLGIVWNLKIIQIYCTNYLNKIGWIIRDSIQCNFSYSLVNV